jgi:large subunit ribosomal protein L24
MTQPKFKIKKGDLVEVMTGKDKGKRGEVQKVHLADALIVVQGVNEVTRFLKPSQSNPDGPVRKTLPINISNVALVDPSTNVPGKVGYRISKEGSKERFFKKSGTAV